MVLVLKVCSNRNFADEMSPETMIPGIKLFGRKIPAPDRHIPAESEAGSQIPTESHVTTVLSETSNREADQCRISGNSLAARAGEKADKKTADGVSAQENSDTKDELSEQEKTFKKPDKILPCPRCSSFDTKFCYFNNYNVNQPRHFCKNCQRYWTAGGTMRNVPVGAGRRKNKHFASQYRQAILSVNGMPGNKPEAPDSTNHHVLLPPAEFASAEARGTVLKFGPETSLSESIENALHLKDQYKEDPSSGGSSATTSNEQKEPMVSPASSDNYNPLPHPVHHQQIPALFLPWNNLANVSSVQWCSTPMVAIPGISCPPNIPLQIMPAPYMGCVPLCPPGTGNVPLALFNGGHCLSPSSSTSNSGSFTLGKHLRDPSVADVGVMENSVLVPKTLRVDDPNEACRSPIWTALGIKQHEKVSIMSDHVVAKGFGPKETVKGSDSAGSHIMEANPAAFSRSQTFLENT